MPVARRAHLDDGRRPRRLLPVVALSVTVAAMAAVGIGVRAANAGQPGSSTSTAQTAALGGSIGTSSSAAHAAATPRTSAKPSPTASPSAVTKPAAKNAAAATKATAKTSKAAVVAPRALGKKGAASAWSASTLHDLNDVGASWFYNWNVSSGLKPAKARFVPMIWGPQSVNPSALAQAKKGSRGELLGFNEPDRPDQANITPQKACDLWPQLQKTGLRLGAPAVSWGADVRGGWLDQFMTCVGQRHLRVDFIPLHFYSSNYTSATNDLERYITATYARYHKPVWITEYALLDFGAGKPQATPAQQSAFVQTSTAMLNRLPSVQCYAWFALEYDPAKLATGLYDANGRPTPWGLEYRKAR